MKNLLISCLYLLLLLSCTTADDTSNSDESNLESSVLIKRAVTTSGDIQEYLYVGSKLDKIYINDEDEINYIKFSYTGDLITSMKYLDIKGNPEGDEIIFTYDNNRMIRRQQLQNNVVQFVDNFTYNLDSTITLIGHDPIRSNNPDRIRKFYFDNFGNITKFEDSELNTTTYSHDTNKSPYRNITGFKELSFFSLYLGELFVGYNNIVISEQGEIRKLYNYSYNSSGYPSSVEIIESDPYDGTSNVSATITYY